MRTWPWPLQVGQVIGWLPGFAPEPLQVSHSSIVGMRMRVSVRMMFHRQLAVGLLEVLFRSIAIDAKHFVVVAFRHFLILSLQSRRLASPNDTRGEPDVRLTPHIFA